MLAMVKKVIEVTSLPGVCLLLGSKERLEAAIGETWLATILFAFVIVTLGVPAWIDRVEHQRWRRENDAKWRALGVE